MQISTFTITRDNRTLIEALNARTIHWSFDHNETSGECLDLEKKNLKKKEPLRFTYFHFSLFPLTKDSVQRKYLEGFDGSRAGRDKGEWQAVGGEEGGGGEGRGRREGKRHIDNKTVVAFSCSVAQLQSKEEI